MVAKCVMFLALVAMASASNFNSFAYSVADPYTGDFKNQIEARLGDNVEGQYSLLESDGTRRTVDYKAGVEGFNAVVRKDPALIAALPLTAGYAAGYATPLSVAAPITKLGAIGLTAPLPLAAAPLAKIGAIGLTAPLPYGRIW